MMRNAWLVIVAMTLLTVADVLAQEEADGKTVEADFVMAELKVVLKGEDGEEVVGAMVMPYAMRMVEIDGHGFWDERKYGVPKEFVSDANGVATIRYPASMKMEQLSKLTTKLVTFQIKHTDYVQKVVHCELGPDLEHPITSTDVQLKRDAKLSWQPSIRMVRRSLSSAYSWQVALLPISGRLPKTEANGPARSTMARGNDAGRPAKRWPDTF
ncbi:MAG: hypothetical protein R3C56_00690 [Pirellulaceae bacterium]